MVRALWALDRSTTSQYEQSESLVLTYLTHPRLHTGSRAANGGLKFDASLDDNACAFATT